MATVVQHNNSCSWRLTQLVRKTSSSDTVSTYNLATWCTVRRYCIATQETKLSSLEMIDFCISVMEGIHRYNLPLSGQRQSDEVLAAHPNSHELYKVDSYEPSNF
jgi:hypothetical protein